MKTKEVALDEVVLDAGTQFRAKTNNERVEEYACMIGDGLDWPFDSACDVVFDGTSYYLVDGFHRYLAAKSVGRESLKCNVTNGTLRDAIKAALSANSRHGLYRSNEDKRKAVEFALADSEWGKLSNVAIAQLCGVNEKLIRTMREVISGSAKPNLNEKRTGKDGKQYPATKPKEQPFPLVYEDVPAEESEPETEREPQPPPKPTKKQSAAELAIENAHHIASVRQLVYGLQKAMKSVPEVEGTQLYHARLKRMLNMVDGLPGAIRACEPYKVCGHCGGKGCAQCGNHGWVSSSVKE
jgi:hypothetical protein